jgi:hypothetical protein
MKTALIVVVLPYPEGVRPHRLARVIALAAVGGALALPASAAALSKETIAAKIFQDYALDGQIDACKHTSDELRYVLKLIPADLAQYAPDYPAELEQALQARARGDCAGKQTTTAPLPRALPSATPVVTPVPTPVATAIPTKTVVPEPPKPLEAPTDLVPQVVQKAEPPVELRRVAVATPDNEAPAPVLLLALLAGLLLVSALFLATMRRLGWADERLAPARHAIAEAGWRFGGMWEDFRDWVRLGR